MNKEALKAITKALVKIGEARGALADYLAKYEKGQAALALKEAEALVEQAQDALMQ